LAVGEQLAAECLGEPCPELVGVPPSSGAQEQEDLDAALRGDELGPWLPTASAHIRCDDGSIVAAIVISNRLQTASGPSGPWITDVFVDPTLSGHGLGQALIFRAAHQLVELGYTSLGLAVTHGNPAIRVYERLGFRIEREVRRFRPETATAESRL